MSSEEEVKPNADSKTRPALSMAVSRALRDGGPTFKQQTMGLAEVDPMGTPIQLKSSRSKNSSSAMQHALSDGDGDGGPSFKMQTREVDPPTPKTARTSNQSSRVMPAQASTADNEETETEHNMIVESPPPVQDAQVGHPVVAMAVDRPVSAIVFGPGFYCTKRMLSLTVLAVCLVLTLILVAVVLIVLVVEDYYAYQ